FRVIRNYSFRKVLCDISRSVLSRFDHSCLFLRHLGFMTRRRCTQRHCSFLTSL
ncbi:hypothetical protein L9F63_021461, partial [Diploptera punctata]